MKKAFKNKNPAMDFITPKTDETQETHVTDDVLKEHETQETHNMLVTQQTHNVFDTHETQQTHKAQRKEVYRFNLCMPIEYKDFLNDASWKARMTITEYINSLIKEKMDK